MRSYILKANSRAKAITIKIGSQQEILVTAPPRTSRRKIDNFINQSEEWIEAQLAAIKRRSRFGVTDTHVMIFGKKHQKTTLDISPFSKLDSFLQATAEKYLRLRTSQLAKKMDISYNRLTIRQQKTRWGSCSTKGNLNFNWRLVHYPTEVIDYVIIHELAHRRHMNHSTKFWQLVQSFDPAYLKHKGWLKRNGVPVG